MDFFFSLKETKHKRKALSTFRNTKSGGGGGCYLWFQMDAAKKKKGKTSTRLIKPLSQLQEVNGGGFMAHLMDVGPVLRWDAPRRGMPGHGVHRSITPAATQEQGTLPVP